MWLDLGIESEKGRKEGLTFSENTIISIEGKDTSIFDPVLCEICYKWFCPKKGKILDPFAGGSVRGILAGKNGFDYVGIDLNDTQIKENIIQKEKICPTDNIKYFNGDSNDVLDTIIEKYDDIVTKDIRQKTINIFFNNKQEKEENTQQENLEDLRNEFPSISDESLLKILKQRGD